MPDHELDERAWPFTPGESVAIIELLDGKIWTVRPVTVIKDTATEIALWLAPGTVTKYPAGPQHGEHTVRQWITREWDLIDKAWDPPGKLRVTRPGDPFDVWTSPAIDTGPSSWYVNLQEPLRRINAGFTTMDHVLDIVVASGLDAWEWKDEAEFDYAQRAGFFLPARAAEIRKTGRQIITAIEASEPPWDTSWALWSPP